MINVSGLAIQQGDFTLRDVSFTVPAGRYGVLMGSTGSGKTTVLECICGLRRISSGSVVIGDRDVTALKPAERGIGYVPQESALFNTMSVFENIAFSLSIRHWSQQDMRRRVQELAELLGIDHLLRRRPLHLSGGERQRVALGRALAFKPDTLLLDEPLSALDEDTRFRLEDLLRDVQREIGVTALHITHSPAEAQRMADLIIRIRHGAFEVNGNERDRASRP